MEYDRNMEKLTFKNKIGYASAAFGDAASYSFVNSFLLFFLTTVAGIEPAAAGTITIVGAIWNTLINPIVGYISDNAATKWGRRRPFMFAMSLPLAASIYLLFTAVELIPQIRAFYYGAVVIIFWSAYTGFFVPYLALGAEYTQDYNERTELRSYASIFNMLGNLVGLALPAAFADFLCGQGMSTAGAWSVTGGAVGLSSMLSIFITAKAAGPRDKSCCEKGKKPLPRVALREIFGEYGQVLKLEPVKYLLFTSLFALICNTMIMSDLVYYFTYNHGLSANQISGMFFYRICVCILLILVMKKISAATDKRTALLAVFAAGAIAIAAAKFTGVEGALQLYVFVFFVAVATSIYWQLMPAIIYDVCEYDELETGKKRQGAIVSLQGLVEALASGIGAQLLGIILQLGGFDGEAAAQTRQALVWVENSATVIPAVFLGLAFVALYKYPITKKRFEEIQRQLEERKRVG